MFTKKWLTYCCFLFIALVISCTHKEASDDKELRTDSISGTWSSDTAFINGIFRAASGIALTHPDSVEKAGRKTLQLSQAIEYESGIGDAYLLLATAYFYSYTYDSALYYYTAAFKTYEKTNNYMKMGKAQHGLSYTYSVTSNVEKALEAMQKSKEYYEAIGFYSGVYECVKSFVFYSKQLNNNEDRTQYISELIDIARKSGDKKRQANSYIILGNYYVDQASMKQAIESYFKALKISEESGDSLEIAYANGSIGLANYYLGNLDEAITYHHNSETILLKLRNRYELSNTYGALGLAYFSKNDFSKSLEYHRKALAIRKEIDYKPKISSSLHNVATCYYAMQDSTDLALEYIQESMQIDLEIENFTGQAENNVLSGKIYFLQKDYSTAINYLESALVFAEEYNIPDIKAEAAATLSNLYADINSYKEAYKYKLITQEVSDSLMNRENLKKITQLEMQYDFDKKQSEIELNHLQEKISYEEKLRRNKQARNFLILLGALLIGFGIFAYFSYLRSRRANKEKSALLKEIHHRVKNNLQVISSLLNLQSGSINDESSRAAVTESQSRVKSMALIHQLLYQSEMFTRIDFSVYLEQLMSSLQSSYIRPGENIIYRIKSDPIKLDIDTAIPLGLIINELATNAYKYAFRDKKEGIIDIAFKKASDEELLFSISDNGKGFPKDFEIEKSKSLGLKLVKLLSRQIKAKLEYELDNGAQFKIIIPHAA